MLQVAELHEEFDKLQFIYGEKMLHSIYGAGQIVKPKFCFVFMNPTGRNVSSTPNWEGLRAPWIGTKQVWQLFLQLGVLSKKMHNLVINLKPSDWNSSIAEKLYSQLSENSVYVTNLAKCTQVDARPLPNIVFKQYRDLFLKEIKLIDPQFVVTFGNQVSSIILERPISVGKESQNETALPLIIGNKTFRIYPTYYPVGQGRRNLPLAVERILAIT